MDFGSKQATVDPALPAQASAARVIRSCSRFCPPLSIVPNPAADPGADAIHATTTKTPISLQRRRCTSRPSRGRCTSRPPDRHHPEPATPPTRTSAASPGGDGRGGDATSRRLGLLTDELDHCEREHEAECDEQ